MLVSSQLSAAPSNSSLGCQLLPPSLDQVSKPASQVVSSILDPSNLPRFPQNDALAGSRDSKPAPVPQATVLENQGYAQADSDSQSSVTREVGKPTASKSVSNPKDTSEEKGERSQWQHPAPGFQWLLNKLRMSMSLPQVTSIPKAHQG